MDITLLKWVFSSFFLLNDNKMELSAFNESNRGVKKQTTGKQKVLR